MAEYIERDTAKEAVVKAVGKGHSPFNAIVMLPAADVVSASNFRDCRNELCLKCGAYTQKHLGACNGCRWR